MSYTSQEEYINQINENAQKMYEPWSKLNQAFLKNAEKMTAFSLDTMKTYSEIGLDNMRQVAEIDSPETAKAFNSKQAEVLNSISQQMLADAKRMTELGKSMQEEVIQAMNEVYGETNEQMQASMQKTADRATKTAQEFTANMSKMAEQATEQAVNATKAASDAASTTTQAKTTATKPTKV